MSLKIVPIELSPDSSDLYKYLYEHTEMLSYFGLFSTNVML